ncbi:MAG: ABC-2 type transport system ATP-binding protein [Saprospiraceae bacterium]|jgi:ABC-2 type transport system ATP-binding protein
MSVIVEGLTKLYGTQKAVDQLSFEAKKGEVLGFLGPNGAGKTTTMKIISCFIPQTVGSATICGYQTDIDPMEVRKKIGYLPEHNPLYKEMYIKEYLNFVAGLHKISNKRQRVAEMIEMTGLGREQNKKIGEISKGYKQRVGLAQAMIHDPEVLILDEPTSGLDPNQLVEIRSLIKRVGASKTVIFSTHIMQEVQAVCDRVVIINKGKLVANDDINTLQSKVRGESLVSVQFLESTKEEQLSRISNVLKVQGMGDKRWLISADLSKDIRADLFKFAVDQKLTIIELKKEVSSVEDVFQQLTAI